MSKSGADFGITAVALTAPTPNAAAQSANTAALQAMVNYMTANGGAKVDLSDLTGYVYYNGVIVMNLATNGANGATGGDFHLTGHHACILRGPGFRIWAVDSGGNPVASGQHVDSRGLIENLTLYGKDFSATPGSIGLDFLRPNGVTIQHCVFNGYYDAIVVDQVQDTLILNNEIRNFGRSGIYLPRGPEVHASVNLANSSSNVATILGNHINGSFASPPALDYGIIDHGGLQHTIQGNQISNCSVGIRLGTVTDCVIRTNDVEAFAEVGALAIDCVRTGMTGADLGGFPGKIDISDGNYFDKQLNLGSPTPPNAQPAGGVFSLTTRNNRFRPGAAVTSAFTNAALVRNIWSLGNEAVDSSGATDSRVFDGVPSGLFFQMDLERVGGVVVQAVNVPPNNQP